MAKKKLNGSADLLAKAMRKVFTEAVEDAVEPLSTQVKAMRTEVGDLRTDVGDARAEVRDLKEDVDERLTRIETDMENGFAELRPPK